MLSAKTMAYAAPANVLQVIERYRERGLPDPITTQVLESVGIPTGNAARTLQALRFFSLVNQDGTHSVKFDRLRRASTDEYRDVLAEIVRGAYDEVLTIIDPARDSLTQINDAFRHYEPAGQRPRMVALFLGMARAAGIGPAKRHRRTRQQAPRPTERTLKPKRIEPNGTSTTGQVASTAEPNAPDDENPDYRVLSILLQRLPKNAQWKQEQRDRWLQALTAALDLVVEVTSQ